MVTVIYGTYVLFSMYAAWHGMRWGIWYGDSTSTRVPDLVDFMLGLGIAAVFFVTWPLILIVLGAKSGLTGAESLMSNKNDLIFNKMFPRPETKDEKRARLEAEQRKSIEDQRALVNAREAELEMELTKW